MKTDWVEQDLVDVYKHIEALGKKYGIDIYPNEFQIVSSDQMSDAMVNIGLPINYNHWSFGKQSIQLEQAYKRGQTNLPYELVINSDPCINYLMEENTYAMQVLVMCHAGIGHNAFFKNNYVFKTWTNAKMTIDYMNYCKDYVEECEQKYGEDYVERTLDCAHMLQEYGVSFYKKPRKLSVEEERDRHAEREEFRQKHFNVLYATDEPDMDVDAPTIIDEENILYFLEKNSLVLKPWQRELLRIVRNISQYFYAQRQTKVMNEGFACYIHHKFVNELADANIIEPGHCLECMHNHTNVVMQPDYNDERFRSLNPYTLGFHMFKDIERICEHPTEEDERWFPELVHTNAMEAIKYAAYNFKDETFIEQYLSPHLIRELGLFTIDIDSERDYIEVADVADDEGYEQIRHDLANEYSYYRHTPKITIAHLVGKVQPTMYLKFDHLDNYSLTDSYHQVKVAIESLWGGEVRFLQQQRLDFDGSSIYNKYIG